MKIDESSTRRINPDSIQTLWLTVALIGFLAVASFMVSFTGLHEVAAWAGLPEWLRWAVPVFIDVAILAYTLAVLIHRHRGESTWASWLSLAGFTIFSMVANASHALAIPHPNMGQQVVGAAVAAIAPVSVFAATEQLGRLVIRRPDTTKTVSVAAAVSKGPAPTGPQGGESVSNRDGDAAGPSRAAVQEPVGRPAQHVRQPAVPVQVPEPVPVSAFEAVGPGSADPAPASVAVTVSAARVEGSEGYPAPPAPRARTAAVEWPVASPGRATVPLPRRPLARPSLSVVGAPVKPASLAEWVVGQVAAGNQPKGKDAATFLGVSERTGRRNLTELKAERPELFEPAAPFSKEGTTR